MDHLLVQKAFTYEPRRQTKDPEGCEYDVKLGAWLWGHQKEFLVKSNNPYRPRPTTKKQDMETGEDQKEA